MQREPWVRVAIGAAVAAVATAVAVAVIWRRREDTLGPEGVVDAEDRRRRDGSAADRGTGGSVAIDVEQLRRDESFEPAVEYLTYIQSRRGVDEHMLFIRNEDLDAIAALDGEDPEEFLERLQHLGVVISTN